MKNEVIFLLVLLLLVSVPSGSTTPQRTATPTLPAYTLSDIEMGVYQWITPAVNSSYASSMAQAIAGLRGTPTISEGIYNVTFGNRTFLMDTRDGSMRYMDYRKLLNVSLGIEIPSSGTCREIAESFLDDIGILPENAIFSEVIDTTASAFNPDSGQSLSKVLHRQVNFKMTIDGYDVKGPRAQIGITVGEGGDVIGVDYSWRQMTLHSTIPVITYDSILDIYGIKASEVVSHGLQYYAGPDQQNEDLLFPVYEIVVDPEGDGLESPIPFQLSATELAPMVVITTPAPETTVTAGQAITFQCNVTNGEAPYTYSWSSDIDGVLSNEASFTKADLSAATRNGTPIAHTIVVWVEDVNHMMTSAFVTIMVTAPAGISPTMFAIGFGILCLIGLLAVMRRHRSAKSIIFLLILFSAFLFIPIAFAGIDTPQVRELAAMAPTGAYDDGKVEVGIEWVGVTHPKPLPNTKTNIEGFYNFMGQSLGYSREFNWGEYSAWEQDFKYVDIGGDDSDWVDAVDFVYYQDHGGPYGVAFTSQMDDGGLHSTEARWGDGDLEFIVFDACSVLMWQDPTTLENVWERWTPAFRGLHLMLSFATGSMNVQTRGLSFAFSLWQGYPLINSWFYACAVTEGSDIVSAVLYATASPDPWQPQPSLDPSFDKAHTKGQICVDPSPGLLKWFVYITYPC